MEKIKNLLHDFGDIFIAFIIAILMFGVVAWNLGDWFQSDDIGLDDGSYGSTSIETSPKSEVEIILDQPSDEKNSTSNPLENNTEDKEKNKLIKITIPSGTPGSIIAEILYDNNLIEDTQSFLQTVQDLNLTSKLKSGTFEIPKKSTMEEIIDIITKAS